MSAVLFGSISTLADTSELQREAFNQAFEAHGLDWRWDRDAYVALLERSGGADRIAAYAESVGEDVDAAAIHRSKSELFQRSLAAARLPARPGVVETIAGAKDSGVKVALVTTTSAENVASLIAALDPAIAAADFDVIVDASKVEQPKPDKAAYAFALERLGEEAADCVAIEDNLDGVDAARAADLECVAFPNANTAGHRFDNAGRQVDRLVFAELQSFIPNA